MCVCSVLFVGCVCACVCVCVLVCMCGVCACLWCVSMAFVSYKRTKIDESHRIV